MNGDKFSYRTKTIFMVAAVFVTVWLVFNILVTILSHVVPTEAFIGLLKAPHVLFVLVSAVSLFSLWRLLDPIEKELERTKTKLEQERSSFAEKIRSAEKDALKAYKNIEIADQSRHEFLGTMSHELRGPLNTIIGFSSLLYQNIDEEKVHLKRRAYAFDINKAAMHVLTIVNDILDISNLSTGTSDLRIDTVSINEMLHECHQLVEVRGTKTGLAILYDLPPHDMCMACDPARMKQILLNLLSNAVKFTDPPGIIRVSVTETPDDYIQFIIADDGIGIPVDDMQTVLNRFGKVDSQIYADRNEGGIGLGLSLVQELVKMHEGHFALDSKEDVGTTVTVRIPKNLMPNVDAFVM